MLNVAKIVPTERNAHALARSARADMVGSYDRAREYGATFTDEQEQAIAKAVANVTAERTLKRIQNNEGQYFVARKDGQPLAFGRFNHWGLADQAPYESGIRAKVYEGLGSIGIVNTFIAPLGIFSLFGAEGVSEQAQEKGLELLTKHVIDLAGNREIRIGLSVGDPLTETLDENYFEPTDKIAHDVTHVPALDQVLYIRKNNP